MVIAEKSYKIITDSNYGGKMTTIRERNAPLYRPDETKRKWNKEWNLQATSSAAATSVRLRSLVAMTTDVVAIAMATTAAATEAQPSAATYRMQTARSSLRKWKKPRACNDALPSDSKFQ